MGLTLILLPAALVLLAFAVRLAAGGVRRKSWGRLVSALGIFAFLAAGGAVLMEFITRPL